MSPCAGCNKVSPPSSLIADRFLPFEKNHWPALQEFLKAHPHSLTGYTLGCLMAWENVFGYRWAFLDSRTLLISCNVGPAPEPCLLQPVGEFGPDARARLLAWLEGPACPPRIVGVEPEFLAAHPDFAARFDIQPDRSNFNYIYRACDLASLAGRRYARKRNLIAQASRSYEWAAEPLTPINVHECLEVLQTCLAEDHPDGRKRDEDAIRAAVAHFGEIELSGVLVRVRGAASAFAIYGPQAPDMAVVHFEVALRKHKGLYQIINKAAAQAIMDQGFSLINREEDLGDEGLRQSKESYFPLRLNESFRLDFKGLG